jgi:uncharacterized protein (TIGR02996 family)
VATVKRAKSKPAKASNASKLFEAVYDNPFDDAPRLVLGDALLEQGDPRGELIAEQQRRLAKGVATPSKRERALVKAHGESWLEPLGDVLRQPTYRLGFLCSAAIQGGVHDLTALAQRREWRTLEKLFVGQISPDSAVELLSLPSLAALREVSAVGVPVLQAVAARRGPLSWTTLTSVPVWGADDPFGGYDLLAQLHDALPKLTRLELAGSGMMSFAFEEFEALLASKLVAHLQHLELHCEDDAVEAVLAVAVQRALPTVVVYGDLGERWVWTAKTKTLSAPEGSEVSLPGVKVIERARRTSRPRS